MISCSNGRGLQAGSIQQLALDGEGLWTLGQSRASESRDVSRGPRPPSAHSHLRSHISSHLLRRLCLAGRGTSDGPRQTVGGTLTLGEHFHPFATIYSQAKWNTHFAGSHCFSFKPCFSRVWEIQRNCQVSLHATGSDPSQLAGPQQGLTLAAKGAHEGTPGRQHLRSTSCPRPWMTGQCGQCPGATSG